MKETFLRRRVIPPQNKKLFGKLNNKRQPNTTLSLYILKFGFEGEEVHSVSQCFGSEFD